MKKLSKSEKLKNKRFYKQIKKSWETTDKHTTYKQYKNRVLAEKTANDLTNKEAIKKVRNSEAFTSAAERSRENFIESLKSNFRKEYDKIRNLSRQHGRFRNIKENLTWDKKRAGYTFTDTNNVVYFIDVTNSPEEVNIYAI